MSWSVRIRLAFALILSFGSATAHAQEPASGEEQAEVQVEGDVEDTAATDGRDREARALFEAGQTAFDDGRFENALDYFERSYSLSQRPQLLYNVGVTAERLRRDERAITALRQYLEDVPDVPNRSNIERRISILEAQRVREEPETRERSSGPGAGPWILAGVGAAFAIAGTSLVGVAVSHRNAVQDAEMGSMWSDVEARADKVGPLSGIGFATLGLGAAMIASGLIWWGVASGDSEDDTAERPRVGFGLGSVSVHGSF